MKKIIILLSLIFILISCNKEVSKENVGVNSGSITNTGNVEVSKKDENLAIENSGSLEEEKVSSGSVIKESNNSIDDEITFLKNQYLKGGKIENIKDIYKLNNIFGQLLLYDYVPLNNYLKFIDNYLVFEILSDAYGDATIYFYNLKTKEKFIISDFLNFNSGNKELNIKYGNIKKTLKDYNGIEYLLENEKFDLNIISKERNGNKILSIFNIEEILKKDENLAIENSGSIINSGSLEEEKTNNINFSDSQIQEIIIKIDENIKKQKESMKTNSGILIDGIYKAEYLPSEYNTDDKIKITIDGKENIISLPYNELNRKIHKNKGGDDLEKFLYFDGFSPSKYYLKYTVWVGGYGSYKSYLIDVNNGKTIIIMPNSNFGLWSMDKKQFIYNKEFGGLFITKKGDFPKTENIGGNLNFSGIYIDDKYIYGICFETMEAKPKFLKIYDILTYKEVFLKEIGAEIMKQKDNLKSYTNDDFGIKFEYDINIYKSPIEKYKENKEKFEIWLGDNKFNELQTAKGYIHINKIYDKDDSYIENYGNEYFGIGIGVGGGGCVLIKDDFIPKTKSRWVQCAGMGDNYTILIKHPYKNFILLFDVCFPDEIVINNLIKSIDFLK